MSEVKRKIMLKKIIDIVLSREQTSKTILKRRLIEETDVTESEIDRAIKYGVDNGVLYQEKGGYVYLSDPNSAPSFKVSEEDYYEVLHDLLCNEYKEFSGKNGQFLISKTARANTKIAGRWTRPDFTVVTNRKFPYIKENEFDIITFEAKSPDNCDTLAVFEALAHNSAATRSYVVVPMVQDDFNKKEQADRIKEECGRHGIGLKLVDSGYHLNKLITIIESQRRPLNPEKCSQFLKNVLDTSDLESLSTW